jgi:hypothetical protein
MGVFDHNREKSQLVRDIRKPMGSQAAVTPGWLPGNEKEQE